MNRYPDYRGGGITRLPHYGAGGFFRGLGGGLLDLLKDVGPQALSYMNPYLGIPAGILKDKLEGKSWKQSLVGGAKNLMLDQAIKAGMAKAGKAIEPESIYEVDYADPDVDLDKLTGRGQYAPGGDSYTDSTLYKAWDEPGEEFGLASLWKNPKSLMDIFSGGVDYYTDPANRTLMTLIGSLDNQTQADILNQFGRMNPDIIMPATGGGEGRTASAVPIDSSRQGYANTLVRMVNGGILPGYENGGEYDEPEMYRHDYRDADGFSYDRSFADPERDRRLSELRAKEAQEMRDRRAQQEMAAQRERDRLERERLEALNTMPAPGPGGEGEGEVDIEDLGSTDAFTDDTISPTPTVPPVHEDPYGPDLGESPTQAQIDERARKIAEETRRHLEGPDPTLENPVGESPDPDVEPTDGFVDEKGEAPDPVEFLYTGESGHGTDMGPGYEYPTFKKPIMPGTSERAADPRDLRPTAEGYRAGFMPETARTTGGSIEHGADPFAPLGSPEAGSRYADLVNRLEQPPIDRTPVATVAKGGMIPGYQEGGMTGTMPPELMEIVREALMNPSMESNEILQILAQQYPQEMAAMIQQVRGTQQMNTGGIVTEGYIPEFADGSMESSGAVDDRVAVSKDDLVEEDFQDRLENGGPLDVVAALAPNEFIITANQTLKSDPEDMVEAAEAIPPDTPPGEEVWNSFTNNLDRVI